MADESPEIPVKRAKKLRMPRGINTQGAVRRAHHRINNWLLDGLISESKANSLHRGVEGMGQTLVAETNEKLLERVDALEVAQGIAGRTLEPRRFPAGHA
jgi:hypothetical protein